MVSPTSYRIQLSSASCKYKTNSIFRKRLHLFSQKALYLVHGMFGGHGFRGFVLIAIGKMEILATFPHSQDEIKVIRRYLYEGWYYTKLVSYVIIFYLETDWSRIRPLPSTTLIANVN